MPETDTFAVESRKQKKALYAPLLLVEKPI